MVIGTIGPSGSHCTEAIYEFGMALGGFIARNGWMVVNGGLDGFMEAVCRGASEAGTGRPVSIGLLPGSDKATANSWCDVVIPTGLGLARNHLIILTADVLVAAGGGAGTLSELAYAWQHGKTVICHTGFGGSAARMAGTQPDSRHSGLYVPAKNWEEVCRLLKKCES